MGKRLPEICWADLGDSKIVIVASSWFFFIKLHAKFLFNHFFRRIKVSRCTFAHCSSEKIYFIHSCLQSTKDLFHDTWLFFKQILLIESLINPLTLFISFHLTRALLSKITRCLAVHIASTFQLWVKKRVFLSWAYHDVWRPFALLVIYSLLDMTTKLTTFFLKYALLYGGVQRRLRIYVNYERGATVKDVIALCFYICKYRRDNITMGRWQMKSV